MEMAVKMEEERIERRERVVCLVMVMEEYRIAGTGQGI